MVLGNLGSLTDFFEGTGSLMCQLRWFCGRRTHQPSLCVALWLQQANRVPASPPRTTGTQRPAMPATFTGKTRVGPDRTQSQSGYRQSIAGSGSVANSRSQQWATVCSVRLSRQGCRAQLLVGREILIRCLILRSELRMSSRPANSLHQIGSHRHETLRHLVGDIEDR